MLHIENYWQSRWNWAMPFLWPLSQIFCFAVFLRKIAYKIGILRSNSLPVPVVIVGNISVGGTGKTPLVIWLARHWQAQGWHVGVLTRGYLGKALHWPQTVLTDSDPYLMGDEAVILARRCGCPVVAGPNRLQGGMLLIQQHGCNLVLCDDGLQHYALQRNLEIAVVDGLKRLGNKFCLPAGPLREKAFRLNSCDVVVINGKRSTEELGINLQAQQAIHLCGALAPRPLAAFRHQDIVAIAGVGSPERFFTLLQEHGLQIQKVIFPDHHAFRPQDFAQFLNCTVLMTEKDAVKCQRFINIDEFWYVPIDVVPDSALVEKFRI